MDLDAKMAELEHRIRKRASKIGTRTIDELASGTSIAVKELQEHVAEKVAERVAEKAECSRDEAGKRPKWQRTHYFFR
eukprot:SAG31_NODE_2186_length_6239_cov_2.944951_2_plen_78_part_00